MVFAIRTEEEEEEEEECIMCDFARPLTQLATGAKRNARDTAYNAIID